MAQNGARLRTKGKRIVAASAAIVAAAVIYSFARGPVDTTKDYYYEYEFPEYQVYVHNGVETLVPWDDVPEGRRFLTGYVIDGVWPSVFVPIARVEVTAVDEDGKPDDRETPYMSSTRYIGLNPNHIRYARGGYGAR